jgi:uncharacterized protein YecE (DUF72 family)
MGEVKVGTAGWTDPTLIASGWYPPEADTAEKRLRFYARQFPLVEVDSTYYALPAEQTAKAWTERTPASKDIHERFGYRYSPGELEEWSHKIGNLAADAEVTDVLFNNCYSDYAHVNAQQLSALISA